MGARPKSKPASKAAAKNLPRAAPTKGVHLLTAIALLSLIGLGDAVYLTVKHITGGIVPCTITGGCEQVLNSSYATVGGVPLALIGAIAYFTAFSLATLAAFGNSGARRLLFYLVLL